MPDAVVKLEAINKSVCCPLPVPCPAGYYKNSSDSCALCPVGTYSDGSNEGTCDDCPEGRYTYHMGTRSRDECKRKYQMYTAEPQFTVNSLIQPSRSVVRQTQMIV